MTTIRNSKDRLIFALDVPDRHEAQRLIKELDDSVGCFKVGLQLFVQEGPDMLKLIKDHSSADIFLDLKLHDIPATVRGALRSASNWAQDTSPSILQRGKRYSKHQKR